MSCKNVQILNFNHNIVEVGPDNKIVITDQIKCNSITIPQPVTNILQINSPGPQGPAGPAGGGGVSGDYVTTSSFNAFTASYNTFSGSYNTGSFTGSFSGDGSNLTNLPSQVVGNTGEIQYKNNGIFGGVSTLTYNGSSLVTATNINATGSFSGSFIGSFTEYAILRNLGQQAPPDPFAENDLNITQAGTYIISQVYTDNPGFIYFPDPSMHIGQRITIQNRDSSNQADIGDNGYRPRNINNNTVVAIAQATKTFIAASTGAGEAKWFEI